MTKLYMITVDLESMDDNLIVFDYNLKKEEVEQRIKDAEQIYGYDLINCIVFESTPTKEFD